VSPDFDPWSLLKNAWVVIAGVFVWIFKRHLGEDDLRAAQVRDDINGLHAKIDANHRQVVDLLTRRN
jgi:hypothetical protein